MFPHHTSLIIKPIVTIKLTKSMRQTSAKTQMENYNNSNGRVTPDPKERLSAAGLPPCYNHNDKQATHTLNHPETHQKLYYCEKCSIMLASKGHNIVKVGRNPSAVRRPTARKDPIKTERQREIEQFIGQLSWNIEEISKRYEFTQNLLLNSEEHFNQMTAEITNYFKQIEDILEIQKYMSYNAILNHRAAVEAEVRLLRESMQHEIQELIGIGNDIQNNMEAVELVEIPIYESIMDNYRQKLGYAYEFQDVELSPLPRPSLVFPDVPKMLYSLADKINLKSELPPLETLVIPQALTKPYLSNRSNVSRHQSCENSRSKGNANNEVKSERPKKSLSNFVNLRNAQSIDDRQIVFSFESNDHIEANPIPKTLFGMKMNRQTFHPQEMVFRQSLSLTQIRQNDEEFEMQGNRRYGGLLEETIPIPEEGMMTSQESIAGYFTANTLNYSMRDGNERGEQTQTLLIC